MSRPILALAALVTAPAALAQHAAGELRLSVVDASGLPAAATGEIVNQATQVRRAFRTGPEGRFRFRPLPFGRYKLTARRPGFNAHETILTVDSEVPLDHRVALAVEGARETVTISDSETLLDASAGTRHFAGRRTVEEHRISQPGRALLELVDAQPGWLLEANGVLHPRGSEYDTQYVIDGIPFLDNRSPAFAPALDTAEVHSLTVLTAGFPAEYGRKLGGVIEVVRDREAAPGLHGRAVASAGSFSTSGGYMALNYSAGRTAAGLSADIAGTHRYLDPPVPENFTNRGSIAGLGARLEHDPTGRDRLALYFHSRRAAFSVPNELLQQQAGQRQDRRNVETLGHATYQRTLSTGSLLSLKGMIRESGALLWSNALSTPLAAWQDRRFRDGYGQAAVTIHRGAHEIKAGAEIAASSIREEFRYAIADPEAFDDDVPPRFRFAGGARGREPAAFVQDRIRAGPWIFSAGLRWDRYRLLTSDSAFSPRLGVSRSLPSLGLVVRGAYDRVFQTPAFENLLLASSREAQQLTDETTGWPVPASRGDFYEVGLGKRLFDKARLDAAWFRRSFQNFFDDDVFFNSGVSFPVAFSRASVSGVDARLELPDWGPVSLVLNWSNMSGVAFMPITGGLFLDADDLLGASERFAISQDQRNTASSRIRYQAGRRAWLAFGARYGSGLPVELESDFASNDPRILRRVNLDRGRVRPSWSLDIQAGFELLNREGARLRLQADLLNATDRLNVINYSGLFSGTALGAPRSLAIRLRSDF